MVEGTASTITMLERRSADGLDADVPIMMLNGAVYDDQLDRFFLGLPFNGVRSRHSLRAYGYDILVWIRFLAEARGKTVWQVDPTDIDAFHRARRRSDAEFRLAPQSWNRSVAALDKLYQWAEREKLVEQAPFKRRTVWLKGRGGRRSRVSGRNESYERCSASSDVRYLDFPDYQTFRDVGLRGLAIDGTERPAARDRNGARNALFADILITTGLRLEEASSLLAVELPTWNLAAPGKQLSLALPLAITKGDRGRTILLPRRLMLELSTYLSVERASASAAFASRCGWDRIDRPIFVYRPVLAAKSLHLTGGGTLSLDLIGPVERERLVLCKDDGSPVEAAALWQTEVGQPMRPNSWEKVFARASARCRAAGRPADVSPHQLRHSFAVHMLAMLVQRRTAEAASTADDMNIYHQLISDPLQQVQRLLGHASLNTTMRYLHHVASRADTIEVAVEALLARFEGKVAE
jgi:site-specific recombinase XerD